MELLIMLPKSGMMDSVLLFLERLPQMRQIKINGLFLMVQLIPYGLKI